MIAVALLLAGIWLIVDSQEAPSQIVTLLFGIVIAAIALWALVPVLRERA